ncbi:MAG: helix-turn-helix domain-containing protein [Thaumarchaeota archaeon]|nr:helix-turn-helix domain-containing protein [Nitrososphaerota archaeon]
MWVTKIVLPHRPGYLLADMMKKYGVTCFGYPVSHFVKKDGLHVITVGTFAGEKTVVEKCVSDLRKDKRMIRLDMYDSFAIAHMVQPREIESLYHPLIIHLNPSVVTARGEYVWELASWDRRILQKVITILKRNPYDGKVAWIKQKKIRNVHVISAAPNLTEKQKFCLNLAIENGYYDYPRRLTLTELARIAKLSYSTYQFHLQNAEKKVMPYLKQTYR